MPYTLVTDTARTHFANMRDLRASFAPRVVSVTKGKKLIDTETLDVIGSVVWVKDMPRPADVAGAPTHVQPSTDPDAPSLDDVLAAIDTLELEGENLSLPEETGEDLHDEAPVRFPVNSDEDIEDIVNWQMGRSGGQLPSTITVRPPTATAPARRRSTHARMSHKNCGHAITGEAGKVARAECRARRRAADAA